MTEELNRAAIGDRYLRNDCWKEQDCSWEPLWGSIVWCPLCRSMAAKTLPKVPFYQYHFFKMSNVSCLSSRRSTREGVREGTIIPIKEALSQSGNPLIFFFFYSFNFCQRLFPLSLIAAKYYSTIAFSSLYILPLTLNLHVVISSMASELMTTTICDGYVRSNFWKTHDCSWPTTGEILVGYTLFHFYAVKMLPKVQF